MTKRWTMVYAISIFCTQVLFLVGALFFREMLDAGVTGVGVALFRVTTHEEWNWIIEQPPSCPRESQIYAILITLQTLLSLNIIFAFGDYYRKRRLRVPDVVIPIVGLALYAPCFYYIKYGATHYYLWMRFIPTEVFSLILLLLMVTSHHRLSKK